MQQEKTLVLLKPCTVQRSLIGEIISRFEKKGLRIVGMKMMQLDEAILKQHYAHLAEKPFFPILRDSMMVTPVVAMALEGIDAIEVVRQMAGLQMEEKLLRALSVEITACQVKRISFMLQIVRKQPRQNSRDSSRTKRFSLTTILTSFRSTQRTSCKNMIRYRRLGRTT